MRKIAFLVANDTFPEDPSIPPLHFTQNDAQALKEVLGDPETCGFETRIYLNETSRKVLADLERVSGELDPSDTVLFYYAGHGRVRRDNQLYLHTMDTVTETLGATSIRVRDVMTFLQESFARRRIIILDCCQSGAIGREIGTFRGGDAEATLRSLADSFGCYILTASTAIQQAEEREKDGHGIFTKALIDCLRDPKKESITVSDLFAFASARLKIAGSQTPKQWALDVEGSPIEIGNFRRRLTQLRQQEIEQLISEAREKLQTLVDVKALTERRFETILRDLEADERELFPHQREFRERVIRWLKGDAIDIFDVVGIDHVPRTPPARILIERNDILSTVTQGTPAEAAKNVYKETTEAFPQASATDAISLATATYPQMSKKENKDEWSAALVSRDKFAFTISLSYQQNNYILKYANISGTIPFVNITLDKEIIYQALPLPCGKNNTLEFLIGRSHQVCVLKYGMGYGGAIVNIEVCVGKKQLLIIP
jgi:hypothetical protein